VTGFQADTSEPGSPSCRSVQISTDENISFTSREIFVSAYKAGKIRKCLNQVLSDVSVKRTWLSPQSTVRTHMLTFQALGELWLVLAEEEREEFNKF